MNPKIKLLASYLSEDPNVFGSTEVYSGLYNNPFKTLPNGKEYVPAEGFPMVRNFERMIENQPIEYGMAYDRWGMPLQYYKGEKGFVDPGELPPETAGFTHNHPSGYELSPADIKQAMVRGTIIRAVKKGRNQVDEFSPGRVQGVNSYPYLSALDREKMNKIGMEQGFNAYRKHNANVIRDILNKTPEDLEDIPFKQIPHGSDRAHYRSVPLESEFSDLSEFVETERIPLDSFSIRRGDRGKNVNVYREPMTLDSIFR